MKLVDVVLSFHGKFMNILASFDHKLSLSFLQNESTCSDNSSGHVAIT